MDEIQKFNPNENSLNLREIAYLFWDNKFFVIFISLAVMFLAAIYTYYKPPLYEANTLIQIESGKNQNTFNSLVQQFSFSKAENNVALQIALIQSRFILEPVIDKLALFVDVRKHPTNFWKHFVFPDKDGTISIKKFMTPSDLTALQIKIIDNQHYQLLKDSHVLLRGKTDEVSNNAERTISILITDINAHAGTLFDIIPNPISSTIKDLLSRLKIIELGGEGLNTQTGILQLSLRDSDPIKLTAILNTIVNVLLEKDAQKKALENEKTLSFLYQQLPLAKQSLEKAERALTHYRIKSGRLDMRLETQQILLLSNEFEKEYLKVTMQRVNLLQKYTPSHPFIIGLDKKIKQLEVQKEKIAKRIRNLPLSDQISVDYMRDIKVKNAIYTLLLNKIQELSVIKAGIISDVRILMAADLPQKPLPKKILMVSMAGLALGFLLASLYIMIRKAFHRKINDPRWLEKHLDLTNLAILPYSKQQSMNTIFRRRNGVRRLEILAEKHPRDLSIEALRSLRTSFQIMCMEAENNIVAIMGVSQSIGKSFVALNFSYLLADIGKKILLIDGDIRKGHLNDYFNAKRSPGLTELVQGRVNKREVVYEINKQFYFLPSGVCPSNPADLLDGHQFKELIKNFSHEYDLVIIDTAPVLAVADSILIGKLSAMSLLVIGSGVHEPEEIILTVKQLDQAGIKVMGSVFNTLQPNTTMYGNYRHKYSAYGEDSEAVA